MAAADEKSPPIMSSRSFRIVSSTADKLAFRHFSAGHFKQFCNLFLVPIDYTRTKEIPALLDLSGILERKTEKLRILDVGSPQILSLSLGLYSDLWDITYVNPFEVELEDLRQKSAVLGLNKLKIVNADITRMDTLAHLGTFDYIFSCSVFEHIHPENGGDVVASKNIPQLLDSNGLFIFSVPYYKESFNEYSEGDVYAVKGDPSGKTFFQRFYDEGSLHRQIIVPTGLTVEGKKYLGEKYYSENNIHKRMTFLIGFGKRALLLGRLFNKISDVFMEGSDDYAKLRKPYLALYALGRSWIHSEQGGNC